MQFFIPKRFLIHFGKLCVLKIHNHFCLLFFDSDKHVLLVIHHAMHNDLPRTKCRKISENPKRNSNIYLRPTLIDIYGPALKSLGSILNT